MMTVKEAKQKTVYVIDYDGKVKETSLYEHIMESHEQTTTPIGVAGRIFIRHVGSRKQRIDKDMPYEVWDWGHQGNNERHLISFRTRKEAEQWLFEYVREVHFEADDQRDTSFFDTKEEAQALIDERNQNR